jgi:hypothetical protein
MFDTLDTVNIVNSVTGNRNRLKFRESEIEFANEGLITLLHGA